MNAIQLSSVNDTISNFKKGQRRAWNDREEQSNDASHINPIFMSNENAAPPQKKFQESPA